MKKLKMKSIFDVSNLLKKNFRDFSQKSLLFEAVFEAPKVVFS